MTGVFAVSTYVPMIGVIPLPCSNRSCAVASILFGMGFIEMLLPIVAFHTHPSGAIAACKVCDIGTANKTVFAIITDTLALRAVFLTVGADGCTFFAGAAALTNLNAFRAQITAFAECVSTFITFFPTALAKNCLIAALLTARAMIAVRDGTINAHFVGGTNIGTSCANAAFRTELATAVTFRTLRAVHAGFNSTFLADDGAFFFTAVQTGKRTILTLTAFLAPASYIKITLLTLRAMVSTFGSALLTENCTKLSGTLLVMFRTIHTQVALLTP